jgi:general secretion pathway protein K
MKNIFRRLKYNPLRKKNSKGVALLLAITSMILMVYIASEVSVDSTIEYAVNSQEINRIKAYYAARNSADIAMLRIKLFQQASRMQLPPGFAQELDQIWKFPFAWPFPIGDKAFSADKDALGETIKAALFDGQYEHSISDEGSKIDINDLASVSKTLRDVTKKQLLNIFEQKLTSDEKFREEFQNYKFADLVNRITDWMSPVNQSASGAGDKRSPFQELGETYPPNRGFRTIDELRLIPGMSEEFFSLLSPHITIYGMKSINPNIASEIVLKSLDVGITDDVIKEILKRRDNPDEGGPFKGASADECLKDFKTFIEGRGARLQPEFDQIPFLCDKVLNFRIQATGRSGSGKGAVQKKIIFVVMDLQKAVAQIKTFVDKEKKAADLANPAIDPNTGLPIQKPPTTGPTSTPPKQDPLPKGRPRIVYWSEL